MTWSDDRMTRISKTVPFSVVSVDIRSCWQQRLKNERDKEVEKTIVEPVRLNKAFVTVFLTSTGSGWAGVAFCRNKGIRFSL